jgi:hypothetical protein
LTFWAGQLFAKPIEANTRQKVEDPWKVFAVEEPARLGQFRKHLVNLVELNRETWKHIRAETDDDHEWLPNPKQKGVLGLPVREEMIDAWLDVMGELEALLEGKKVFLAGGLIEKNGKGLNLKTLLDDPPAKFELNRPYNEWLADKYWMKDKEVDLDKLFRLLAVFGDTTAFAYAVWFN